MTQNQFQKRVITLRLIGILTFVVLIVLFAIHMSDSKTCVVHNRPMAEETQPHPLNPIILSVDKPLHPSEIARILEFSIDSEGLIYVVFVDQDGEEWGYDQMTLAQFNNLLIE